MWEQQVFHTGDTVWTCWLLIFKSVASFVWVCVCKLWFEADGAEFAAVRMERHRTDEREREGESVKGKAAASSCPDSLWTPVLGVCVCAQSMTPSTRENAHSWLVIYSAQTTLGTEDRQTGCVCYWTVQWCVGGGGGLRDRAGRGKRGDRRQRSPCPSSEVTELYCAHLCAAL